MRYFIAGGGCYGSYYVRQLDRARSRGLLKVDEIVVVDRKADCAVAATLPSIAGARLIEMDWLDFGSQIYRNENVWKNDMWVPTPIGPHIIYHWVMRELGVDAVPVNYEGKIPSLPYADKLKSGSLVLSHAPGTCPVNCVEPKICPLTKDDRDWEMKDTVRAFIADTSAGHGVGEVGVFVCQHHAHGVGTIPMKNIYDETRRLRHAFESNHTKRLAVATVSSCHGILDAFERKR